MNTLAIIDCGSGNLHSVQAGFARASVGKDVFIQVTTDASVIASADRIVLPGVGAFADCMRGLLALPGVCDTLQERVITEGVPFLGICVGMQMMMERGLEHGEHEGLGWIAGDVVPITPRDHHLKIPHMGWNELQLSAPPHPVFAGLGDGAHMYFVHSFHAQCAHPAHRIAAVQYGETLTAAIGRDNMVGVQFHPEKSQRAGEQLLANFIDWMPSGNRCTSH